MVWLFQSPKASRIVCLSFVSQRMTLHVSSSSHSDCFLYPRALYSVWHSSRCSGVGALQQVVTTWSSSSQWSPNEQAVHGTWLCLSSFTSSCWCRSLSSVGVRCEDHTNRSSLQKCRATGRGAWAMQQLWLWQARSQPLSCQSHCHSSPGHITAP